MFSMIMPVFLLGNVYVYFRIWPLIPWQEAWMKIIYLLVAALVTGSLFLSMMWRDQLPVSLNSLLHRVGTAWFMIFLYLFMLFLLRDLLLLSNKCFHFIPDLVRFKHLSGFAVLLLCLFIMTGGYIRYVNKKRVEYTLQTTKLLGSDPIRIVAVSDLHLGYGIGNGELAKWVKLINAEKPDVVLIAGDLIDNSLRPLVQNNMQELLRQISAPMGVYACLGNHEYISKIRLSEQFFKESNIHLLKDSAVLVHDLFYIIGRDDRRNARRKSLEELTHSLDKQKPLIVLDHQPYHLNNVASNRIDLQVSGHTHRGQVWPISWITDRMYEVSNGWVKRGDSHIYVSSGLGIWGGKFRIGTASEYAVINLGAD